MSGQYRIQFEDFGGRWWHGESFDDLDEAEREAICCWFHLGRPEYGIKVRDTINGVMQFTADRSRCGRFESVQAALVEFEASGNFLRAE